MNNLDFDNFKKNLLSLYRQGEYESCLSKMIRAFGEPNDNETKENSILAVKADKILALMSRQKMQRAELEQKHENIFFDTEDISERIRLINRKDRIEKDIKKTWSKEQECWEDIRDLITNLQISDMPEEIKPNEEKNRAEYEKNTMIYPLKVFISYSHKDEDWKNDLLSQFSNMETQGLIRVWEDRKINPGDSWDDSIKQALRESDLVLFLVSPGFMSSSYIWRDELPQAIERYNQGKSKLVPIYVKPVEEQGSLFSSFQGLPRDHYNGKFLSQLRDRDEGLCEVAKAIRKLIET